MVYMNTENNLIGFFLLNQKASSMALYFFFLNGEIIVLAI